MLNSQYVRLQIVCQLKHEHTMGGGNNWPITVLYKIAAILHSSEIQPIQYSKSKLCHLRTHQSKRATISDKEIKRACTLHNISKKVKFVSIKTGVKRPKCNCLISRTKEGMNVFSW